MTKRLAFRPGPILLGITIVLLLAAAIFLALRTPPLEVDVGQVTQGPMVVTIDDEGETRVHDLFVVAAPINGRLARIELEPGDPVSTGMVVAQLAPVDPDFLDRRTERRVRAQIEALDAAADSSEMRIAQARSQRDLAVKEQARVEALFKRGFATRASLDRVRTATAQTEAQLAEAVRATEAARFDGQAARATLTSPTSPRPSTRLLAVRSPVSGTVMRLPRESEAVVPVGSPLIELGDPRNLEIVTDLLSSDAVRIKPGARVLIENWGGEGALGGRVRRIEPFGFTKFSALGVEEQRVNVIIDFTDPPERWIRLGHGYRVIVRVVEWEKPEAVLIPVSALFREKGGWAVFAVEQGRAKLRAVKIGRMNDEKAELLGGLARRARVILHPSEKIMDGTRVTQR